MKFDDIQYKHLPDWKHLKFQYYPTDYIFISQTDEQGNWSDGEIRPLQDLRISPAAAVLNYGQAIFEGLKALRTPQGRVVLFRPEENAHRLQKSADRLLMPSYPVDDFTSAVEAVVRANARFVPPYLTDIEPYEQPSLYIRPVMIGSGPMLGVNPAPSYTFYIFVSPVGPYLPGTGRVIVLDSAHRSIPHGTGAVKAAANYAGTLLPQKIAKSKGYKDALYLDARQDTYIEELSSSNFFAVLHDGTLVTPPLGSILPGITRDSVLAVARELLGWRVEERAVSIEEVLASSEEAFFTGTAAVVQPITLIGYKGSDHRVGTGELGERTRELRQCLVGIQTQQQVDPFGWVRKVQV